MVNFPQKGDARFESLVGFGRLINDDFSESNNHIHIEESDYIYIYIYCMNSFKAI